MKKNVLCLSLVFISGIILAQTTNDFIEVQRTALKTEKKAAVADAMQLSEAESTVFWPLYNEYNGKLYKLDTKLYELVLEYAKNFENLTDEKAIELWSENMAIEKELLKLKTTYFKKFKKVLSGKTVARYFQTENKIEALINAQIALEIPLIE